MSTIEREYVVSARATDPPFRADAAAHPAVLDRLRASTARVVVVHAPPGYGKTTVVSTWVSRERRPVRWIEIDRADNDPAELLAVLVAALGEMTDFDASGLSSIHGSPEQYSTTVAPRFARSVRRCRQPFVLVLDDAHLVVHPPALDLIDALVHNVPAGSTVVVIGRVEPRVPLASLRVDADLEEITATDLGLDVPAARELLAGMGVTIDDEEVGQLVAATEGWAVGLRLAGQALLAAGDDVEALGGRRLGHDHVVGAYVREEWLRGLDADERDFLVQTSWLGSLSPRFCDHVLCRSDSAEMLDRLHAEDLLVIPLHRRGEEYRMHQLLRSALLDEAERSDPDRRRAVEQRASAWCEQSGDVDGAFEYALRAGDVARVDDLIERHGAARLTAGRSGAVQQWLQMCSREQVLASPTLCLMSAAIASSIGEAATMLVWLDVGRQAADAAGDAAAATQVGAKIAALRSMAVIRFDADELAGAARAYDELAPGIWHAVACCGYGWLSAYDGDDERAARVLAEGAAEARVVGGATIEAQCRAALAAIFCRTGQPEKAAASAREARAIMRAHDLEALPTLVMVTAMSALVEASAGDPVAARAEIALTRRHLAYVRDVATWPNVQSRLALARASLLLGDRVGARTLLDEAADMLGDAALTASPRAQLDELLAQLEQGRRSLPVGPSSLTTAELRLLHYLPTNLSLSDIADRLYVSRNTAKSHAAAVYRKLGVTSRSAAVELARSVGLLAADVADR